MYIIFECDGKIIGHRENDVFSVDEMFDILVRTIQDYNIVRLYKE